VQYAIAYSIYLAHQNKVAYGAAARALFDVNSDRPRLEGPPPSEEKPITP